jgi:hypothetical protein
MASSASAPQARTGIASDWLLPVLAAAAAAVFVFRGSLGYFFGQDDFLSLARARGMAPPLAFPWRWLSGSGYFELMRPLGVASALPYHLASLLAHALTAGLLAVVLRRRFCAPAALLGALYFASHPAVYTALYSVSGIGEILCGLFALATLVLATRSGHARGWALPVFALALLSKETVLLLPLVLFIEPGWLPSGPRGARGTTEAADRRSRRRIAWALCALAAGYAVLLFAQDPFAVRKGGASSAAYALGSGSHVLGNLASYLGWSVNMSVLTTRSFEDAVDPAAFAAAVLAAGLWALGCLWRPLRERGWLAGAATFVLLIAPVLGLRNHTYHYYLYAPLIGVAWCAAALFDAMAAHAPRPARWVVAVALGAGLVLNGAVLVRKIELFPFSDPRLRADPVVDRARIARNVYDGLRAADLPPHTPLVFWSPASLFYEQERHPGLDVTVRETYWERNVRSALMDGLAVRVLLPQSGEVSFIHNHAPAPADARFVLYDLDGRVRVTAPAELDSLLAAHPLR